MSHLIVVDETAVMVLRGTNSLSSELQAIAEINKLHRLAEASYAEHAVACGKLLLQQKERVGHGNFGKWIEANCNFSHPTANNYMFAAQNPNALAKAIRHRFPSGRNSEPSSSALPPPEPGQPHPPPPPEPVAGTTDEELSIEHAIAVLKASDTGDGRRRLKEIARTDRLVKLSRRRLERAEIAQRNARASAIAAARKLQEAGE